MNPFRLLSFLGLFLVALAGAGRAQNVPERRDDVFDRGLRRAVQDHAEGALAVVLAHQEDGPPEVGVEEARSGDQELPAKTVHRSIFTDRRGRGAEPARRPGKRKPPRPEGPSGFQLKIL